MEVGKTQASKFIKWSGALPTHFCGSAGNTYLYALYFTTEGGSFTVRRHFVYPAFHGEPQLYADVNIKISSLSHKLDNAQTCYRRQSHNQSVVHFVVQLQCFLLTFRQEAIVYHESLAFRRGAHLNQSHKPYIYFHNNSEHAFHFRTGSQLRLPCIFPKETICMSCKFCISSQS